jgi:hypothetical protein
MLLHSLLPNIRDLAHLGSAAYIELKLLALPPKPSRKELWQTLRGG